MKLCDRRICCDRSVQGRFCLLVWLSFPTATVPKNTWLSAIFTTFKVTRGHSYSTLIDNHCIYSCLAPFRFMAYCLLHVLRLRWTPRLFGECLRWISPTSLATKTEIPRILCCVVCAATCLAVLIEHWLVSDRLTDGHTPIHVICRAVCWYTQALRCVYVAR